MIKYIHSDYEIPKNLAIFKIASSIIRKIRVAIPKGSTLGSIPFCTYDNDTPFDYKLNTELRTYAGFTCLSTQNSKPKVAQDELQDITDEIIDEWCDM
jgi:hypothetical protein